MFLMLFSLLCVDIECNETHEEKKTTLQQCPSLHEVIVGGKRLLLAFIHVCYNLLNVG